MELKYYCKIAPINWSVLSELPTRLRRCGLETESASVNLHRYPESTQLDSLDGISAYVVRKGQPNGFEIYLNGKESNSLFLFSLHRGINVHNENYLVISLKSANPESVLASVMELLGLSLDDPVPTEKELPRTIFIAHRFDSTGQEAAERVALFLTMLGFECVTGRGYAPGSISEKVKSRLQAQALVVVILTPGEDSTWLIQESLLSNLVGKPLILIKEASSAFKPGLLADHEFISFSSPRIEQVFIPLLEGLRAIGFRF